MMLIHCIFTSITVSLFLPGDATPMNSKDTPDLGDCGGDALELCGPNANCFSKYQGKAYACVCKYGGVHPSCPDEPYDNQSSQKFLISTKNKTFLINVNDENEVENTSIKKEKLDKSGSLTSRNFPSNYPNNLDTEEDISVAAGERIKLQFIDFKIEDHSSCAYDYLMVEDADGTVLLDKTCGSTLPKDVTSRTNTVIVIFHSDGSVSDSGWRIDWQKLTNLGNGGKFTDPRDGNVYGTKTFGNQTWMTENLRFNAPGESFDYNNTAEHTRTHGKLYTFYGAIEAAPPGWHLPSDGEWKILETFLGMPEEDLDIQSYAQQRGTDEGAQLRVGGSSGMNFPMAGYGYRGPGNVLQYDAFGSDRDNFATCDGRCRAYIWGDNKTFPVTRPDGIEYQTFRRRLEARDVQGYNSKIIYRFSNTVTRPDGTDSGFVISARYIMD